MLQLYGYGIQLYRPILEILTIFHPYDDTSLSNLPLKYTSFLLWAENWQKLKQLKTAEINCQDYLGKGS